MEHPDWKSLSKEEKAALVKRYADEHKSAGQIARILGISRNAVVGVVHRNRNTITLSGGRPLVRRKRVARLPRGPKQARLGGPPKTVVRASTLAQIKAMNGPAWTPLEGSTPVTLVERRGCAWPVTVDGRTLFCNCAVPEGSKLPYCETHLRHYGRPM